MKKIIGKVIYRLIAKRLPCTYSKPFGKISNKIRCFSSKMFVRSIGKNVNIEPRAYFTEKLSIGDFSGIGTDSNIFGKVTIGKYVMMGSNCNIYTRNHKFDDVNIPMCMQGFQTEKEVIIGNDVWIGGNVTILPGVSIGDGVVIGANSVITKSIPPYAVVVGNPGAIKKYRKNN